MAASMNSHTISWSSTTRTVGASGLASAAAASSAMLGSSSHLVILNFGSELGKLTHYPRAARGDGEESTRLMLNSGICNSSGALGHYVMDHIYGGGAAGEMPMLESRPWANPPKRPNGIYVPRFRNASESSYHG